MAKRVVYKRIVDRVNEFRDRISRFEDRVNSGNRPRRGIGSSGLKKDHSHYKLGGSK